MLRVKRRFRAKVILYQEALWNVRWIILSLLLALAGFVGLGVTIPIWVQVLLGAVSILLVIIDVNRSRSNADRIQFSPRSTEHFADVLENLASNPRFAIRAGSNGTLILDRLTTVALRTAEITASSADTAYVVPSEIRQYGRMFRRRRVSKNPNAYNEPVLGISSNLGLRASAELKQIQTVEARYWEHLETDHFAMNDTYVDGHIQLGTGRQLFIDRRNSLRDFGDSWLLNAVGVSVLSITTDGRFVAVMQSGNNDSAQGLLAPTGSGSLEPQDYRGASELSATMLFANGALREAEEETNIKAEDMETIIPLGFGRWLEKSAKPEAFFVSFLNVDSHEVNRRRVPIADKPYTAWAKPLKFGAQDTATWNPQNVSELVGQEVMNRLSLPLEACLYLLAEAVQNKDKEVSELLRSRLPARSTS